MANRPKNQHWVPRFYLRHFATPETRAKEEAQIWMFSNQERDGDERLTNIRNVCTRRYLYPPIDDSGQRTWALEEKLAELETFLAPLWSVVAGELIDFGESDIRKMVALFVSVMHLRSPDTLRTVEAIHRRLVDLYETAPENSDGTPNVEIVYASGKAQPLDARNWEHTERPVRTITCGSLLKRFKAKPHELPSVWLRSVGLYCLRMRTHS